MKLLLSCKVMLPTMLLISDLSNATDFEKYIKAHFIHKRTSKYVGCPEYKSIYGDDHEGRSCNNRLTLVDYEKLLDYLTERTYAGDGLQETNLTGLKFTLKGVDYEVLEHTKDKYRVLMLNRKAISK